MFKPLRQYNYFRGRRAKRIYELLGRKFRNATDWRFMNYGFDFDDPSQRPTLLPTDEAERYCAQLYHVVASQVDLTGKRVLDVGSGRGGGPSYIHRYLGPRQTIGLDWAESAMGFCTKVHAGIAGLEYKAGDAQNLPFAAAKFDVVTNVESAHCYSDAARFYAEAWRVLKPGGHLLYADFGPSGCHHTILSDLADAGFQITTCRDITANILRGLRLDHDRRHAGIQKRFPRGTKRLAGLWAGTKGSVIFRDFDSGAREYYLYHVVKPDSR